MGRSVPSRKLDEVLRENPDLCRGCLVDTNFLIALHYEPHPFHEDADTLYRKFAAHSVPLFISLAARAEFVDFQRRLIITETLMDMLAVGSPWRITDAVKKELRKHKTWIDTQSGDSNLPVLSDSRIKDCKKIFSPKNHSGKIGWLKICEEYLTGLLSNWDSLVAALGLRYVGVRETENSEWFSGPIKWSRLYELSGKTCLGSSDAMILNVFLASQFPMLVTMDFDLAYAVQAEHLDKAVIVPNRLYDRHIKGLRL